MNFPLYRQKISRFTQPIGGDLGKFKIKSSIKSFSMSESSINTVHVPVLFHEVLEGLALKEGGTYIDGTLGGGGHSLAIAEKIGPKGLLLGIDRDAQAISRAELRIKTALPDRSVRFAHANYCDFPEALNLLHLSKVDGFLLDLGLSSDQLADRNRGFSFDSDGDLDLRFDITEGVPAYELLNKWSAEKIADTIFKFGEERCSRKIARAIIEKRPIQKAAELAEICRRCVPQPPPWSKHKIDSATRTFQALRIAVNEELRSLEIFLDQAVRFLAPKGRIAIISFHSLEDRIVKNFFRETPLLNILTKKPIEAAESEKEANPRSRSAKLRIAELRCPNDY